LEEVPAAVVACRKLGAPLICGLSPQQITLYDVSWGANDFFISPPLPDEVTKRVSRLVVGESSLNDPQVLYVGNMVIDHDKYEVSCGGDRVILTFKEYQLLSLLASNQGRVYTREELLSDIWGYDYFGGTRTVDVHIRRLRSKLVHGTSKYIETVWNVGYRFRP
jgi:DNA-binding response OmpR family regulator